MTAQIDNNAQGDAPPTRARLVLTPAGLNPGGADDVTIGYLNVPAIPAWQTVNLTQDDHAPGHRPLARWPAAPSSPSRWSRTPTT